MGSSSTWVCRISQDERVRLVDLDVGDLQRIAEIGGLESWYDLFVQPGRNGKSAVALYQFCCRRAGVEPVETVTPWMIGDMFDRVEDDLPTLWEDGHPQTAGDLTTD